MTLYVHSKSDRLKRGEGWCQGRGYTIHRVDTSELPGANIPEGVIYVSAYGSLSPEEGRVACNALHQEFPQCATDDGHNFLHKLTSASHPMLQVRR